jgi:preprotein translocase subunit YajC
MTTLPAMLAQASQPAGAATQAPLSSMLFPLVLIGAVMYFLILRPQSRERKSRASMLDAIKKNDRVVTIGGILGTVLSVKDDEVTLKVDESSNTKITFTKSAIQRILSSAPAESTPPRT